MRIAQVSGITCLFLGIGLIIANESAHAQIEGTPNTPDPTSVSGTPIRHWKFSHSLVAKERKLDLQVTLPTQTTAAPTLLFLAELGSSPQACDYLMEHWAKEGLACIFLSHGDGIDKALEQAPLANRISMFQSLGNSDTLQARSHDAEQAISALRQWSQSPDHPLSGQLDWGRFGIVGHGFGGTVTLQVLANAKQTNAPSDSTETNSRLQASFQPQAICLLGPTPLSGSEQNQLATLPCLPGLIISGDLDESLIRRPDPLRRNHWFASYPDCVDRFELRLLDGRHFDLTNTPLRFGRTKRNPNYHPLLQSITTLFFRAYLNSDPAAREALVNPDINPAIQSTVRWSRALAKP